MSNNPIDTIFIALRHAMEAGEISQDEVLEAMKHVLTSQTQSVELKSSIKSTKHSKNKVELSSANGGGCANVRLGGGCGR